MFRVLIWSAAGQLSADFHSIDHCQKFAELHKAYSMRVTYHSSLRKQREVYQ